MFKVCGYCKRQFKASNYNQKYCCRSCGNCAHSSARLREKDDAELLSVSSYYATESGRDEVARGSHDQRLAAHGISRLEWLVKWDMKCGSFRKDA